MRKPEKVDHIDAAGCIGDVIRAYTALHYQARVCGGETILVVNGASVSTLSVLWVLLIFNFNLPLDFGSRINKISGLSSSQ